MTEYKAEYGKQPLQSGSHDHLYVNDQDTLLSVLSGDEAAIQFNPRKIIFFSPPTKSKNPLLDAWGNRLNTMADWDADSELSVGSIVITQSVAIWSVGPDGTNDYGQGDDIGSWHHK